MYPGAVVVSGGYVSSNNDKGRSSWGLNSYLHLTLENPYANPALSRKSCVPVRKSCTKMASRRRKIVCIWHVFYFIVAVFFLVTQNQTGERVYKCISFKLFTIGWWAKVVYFSWNRQYLASGHGVTGDFVLASNKKM